MEQIEQSEQSLFGTEMGGNYEQGRIHAQTDRDINNALSLREARSTEIDSKKMGEVKFSYKEKTPPNELARYLTT